MTLQTTGPISVSDINVEVERTPTFSSDLNFLNGLIRIDQRPAQPNMGTFYGKAYYQRNLDGNCNNGNCSQSISSGNIQCQNCSLGAVNCANCDNQKWLQANCNCFSGQYNCNQVANQTYNCNCNCGKIICTKLYEMGLMDKTIFKADQDFGNILMQSDPKVYQGYVRWAQYIVDRMDGQGTSYMFWIKDKEIRRQKEIKFVTKWAHKIATPWSIHMAYLMGVVKEDDVVGKIIMNIGKKFCKLAYFFPKKHSINVVTALAMSLTFICIYYIAKGFENLQQKG
jgi:hypothetical protein